MPSPSVLICVEAFPPAPGGMPEVAARLAGGLAAGGFAVAVATSVHPQRTAIPGVRVHPFDLAGNEVRGIIGPAGETERYRSLLTTGGFEAIILLGAQQWAWDLATPLIGHLVAPVIAVPTGFSALGSSPFRAYFARMPAVLRSCAAHVTPSAMTQDALFAQRHGLPPPVVIPNGAAISEFDGEWDRDAVRRSLEVAPDGRLVVHVAHHTGLKGQEDAIRIMRASGVPGCTLALLGQGPKGAAVVELQRLCAASQAIRVLQLEPPRGRLVEVLRSADLMLFPSNLECAPITLIEAMAAGLPFLATPVGNAAELAATGAGAILPARRTPVVPGPRRPGTVGLIRRLALQAGCRIAGACGRGRFATARIAPSARMVAGLLTDDNRLRAMGQRGRTAWREGYTWESVVDRYAALIQKLTGSARP